MDAGKPDSLTNLGLVKLNFPDLLFHRVNLIWMVLHLFLGGDGFDLDSLLYLFVHALLESLELSGALGGRVGFDSVPEETLVSDGRKLLAHLEVLRITVYGFL